ncbi:YadA-like family protein [Streptobacillus notomytis]|uniref:YadA-like family protein n=1 Tax=Streptobacillus notomytis TaxID=1712031 RepID=UPI000935D0DC|nr:YadA-like family protein [Streptobacillus notomytis]
MKKKNLITFLALISILSYTRDNGNNLKSNINLGRNSDLKLEKSMVVGINTLTTDKSSVQIGKDSKAEEDKKAIAIGSSSVSRGTNGVAIGNEAHAGSTQNLSNDVENTVAIGTKAKATATDAIAIGNEANAGTKYGIAIGTQTKTDGIGAISLGYKSEANSDSIGIGKEAVGYGKSVALGENSHSRGRSVAIGYKADSNGIYSYGNVVIGNESSTSENLSFSTAIGNKAKVEENYSTALGSSSIARKRSDRLGYDMFTNKVVRLEDQLSEDNKTKYTSLKEEINRLKTEKAALNKDAKVIIDKDYNSRTEDEKNKLSDLNNKIINKNTEINQKYTEYSKIVNAWEATYGEVSIGYVENGITRQITGLAAGKEDTDAVNVAQLKSLHKKFEEENKTYFHVNTGTNKDTGDKDNNLGKIGDAAGATGDGSIAIGMKAKASGLNSIAIGKSSASSGINSIAMGIDSKAFGITSMALGVDAKSSGITSIALGSNANSSGFASIALGLSSTSSSTHTLALGQLSKANVEKSVALGAESETTRVVATKEVEINGIKYGEFAGKIPFSVLSIGYKDRERQLQYVAAGQISKESTDAINGSQLFATNNVLSELANSYKTILGENSNIMQNGKLTITNIGDTGKNNINDAIKSLGDKIENIDKRVNKIENTEIKLGGDNNTITDGQKIGKDITNNNINTGNQNQGKSNEIKFDIVKKENSEYIETKASGNKVEIDLTDKVKEDIKAGKNAKDTIDNKGLKFKGDSGETSIQKLGSTLSIMGDENIRTEALGNKLDIGLNKNLKVDSIGINGAKLDSNGIDMNNKRISNVLDGVEEKDTVNKKQLDELGNNTLSLVGDSGSTENQTLNKSGGMKFNIKGSEYITTKASGNVVNIDLSDKIKDSIAKGIAANSGVANAIAMSNLAHISGRGHNLSGSYGYYNGEHAFAIGLSGMNNVGNLVYRASGSLNTKGHIALGAGLGYQFKSVSESDNEVKVLKENNKILETRILELEKLVKELMKK